MDKSEASLLVKPTEEGDPGRDPRRVYQPPQVVWRERYEPVSFGLSCGKQPGNPPCIGFFAQ
jgi:hypothetical protein